MSRIGKFIETESRLAVARNWGEDRWEVTSKGAELVALGGDEKPLNLDSGYGCTMCEYAENFCPAHVTRVHFIVCAL